MEQQPEGRNTSVATESCIPNEVDSSHGTSNVSLRSEVNLYQALRPLGTASPLEREPPVMGPLPDDVSSESEAARNPSVPAGGPILRTKGVELMAGDDLLWNVVRYREMTWERDHGRWCGSWVWGEWEKEKPDGREHDFGGLDSFHSVALPSEILLAIIECIIGAQARIPVLIAIKTVATLLQGERCQVMRTLVLVCRAWYNQVAPDLYSTLEVTAANRGSFLRPATALHARRITFTDAHPLDASTGCFRLRQRHFANALWLRWSSPVVDGEAVLAYHPSHVRSCSLVYSAFASVERLDLWHCGFLSYADLLRVLASFPALIHVDLRHVIVNHSNRLAAHRPRVTRLQYIQIDRQSEPFHLPFLMHVFTWCRQPASDSSPLFPCLSPGEASIIARLYELLMGSVADVVVELYPSLDDRASVVWCRPWIILDSPHLEFFLRTEDPIHHTGAAHVQDIIFRVNTLDGAFAPPRIESWLEVQQCLDQLAFLRPLIVERNGGLEESLDRALRDAHVNIQWRTCEVAQELANLASRKPALCSRTEPVSPFWCLEAYRASWADWLPPGPRWLSLRDPVLPRPEFMRPGYLGPKPYRSPSESRPASPVQV